MATERINLLIHADPGARSGFVAAWLLNNLNKATFDTGEELKPKFTKIHTLTDDRILKNFKGIKIRIKPTLKKIDCHCILTMRKNVYVQVPEFTKDEYSLDSFSKMFNFAKELLEIDAKLDYTLYDYVINFEQTFDLNFMIDLYHRIHRQLPNKTQIDALVETNKLNDIKLDLNNSASIVKLLMTRERDLGLDEVDRFWSIVDVYNQIPVDQRYQSVLQLIDSKNYGKKLKENQHEIV